MKLVVKLGGEVIASGEVAAIAHDVCKLVADGSTAVLVHGGGPQATELQKRLGIEPKQVGGRRVTDAATLDVMKMVVAGRLNVDLCAALVAAGLRPVGLHGASGLAVRAVRRPPRIVSGGGPEPVDFGLVGDITGFNLELISLLIRTGYVPVLACLGADEHGGIYNINADVVANQLAAALKADHLFLITSTPGVLRDVKDPDSRLALLSVAEARQAIVDGVVHGGMIPKLEEAIGVAESDVGQVHILGQLRPGDLQRAATVPGSVGTALRK